MEIGSLIIVGHSVVNVKTLPDSGGDDGFVVKYLSTGVFLWAAQLAQSGDSEQTRVTADASGNVYVVGWYTFSLKTYQADGVLANTLPNDGGEAAYMIKLNHCGSFSTCALCPVGTWSASGFTPCTA
jgi:hypothetical protein